MLTPILERTLRALEYEAKQIRTPDLVEQEREVLATALLSAIGRHHTVTDGSARVCATCRVSVDEAPCPEMRGILDGLRSRENHHDD